MANTNFNQTTNITFISSANNIYAIRDTDDIINVRTSLGTTYLILQNIQGSGLLLNPRTIYINDVDGNAQSSPINISCGGADLINSSPGITINANGGSVAISVSNNNEWIAVGNGVSSGGGVTSVGLQIGTSGSNISVSNSPITSSGDITLNIPNASSTTTGRLTSSDWNTFNAKVNGTGSSNFISKWNSPGTLISSIIQDDNVRLGISTAPTSQNKVYIANTIDDNALTILSSKNSTGTTWGINSTISNTNAGGSAIGLNINATGRINSYGISSFLSGGIAGTTQVGGYFEAGNSSNALTNIGLIAIANTTTGGTRYSVRLQDGTQASNRLLKSVDSQGSANWTDIKTVNSNSLLGSGDIVTGTVTNVSALTLGTTGTDITSSVANGTTTPTITLNVPTASAINRGALSSSDWTTFNNKQPALVSGTNIKTINTNSLLGSGNLTIASAPAWLESNATDLTLWNNGKANDSTNTTFGESSLRLNSTGTYNNAFGQDSLRNLTTGGSNHVFGSSLFNVTTGSSNLAFGYAALNTLTVGTNNVVLGTTSVYASYANT